MHMPLFVDEVSAMIPRAIAVVVALVVIILVGIVLLPRFGSLEVVIRVLSLDIIGSISAHSLVPVEILVALLIVAIMVVPVIGLLRIVAMIVVILIFIAPSSVSLTILLAISLRRLVLGRTLHWPLLFRFILFGSPLLKALGWFLVTFGPVLIPGPSLGLPSPN